MFQQMHPPKSRWNPIFVVFLGRCCFLFQGFFSGSILVFRVLCWKKQVSRNSSKLFIIPKPHRKSEKNTFWGFFVAHIDRSSSRMIHQQHCKQRKEVTLHLFAANWQRLCLVKLPCFPRAELHQNVHYRRVLGVWIHIPNFQCPELFVASESFVGINW